MYIDAPSSRADVLANARRALSQAHELIADRTPAHAAELLRTAASEYRRLGMVRVADACIEQSRLAEATK